MSFDKHKILMTLAKLKRLAERGVDGEATVAGAMLRTMMEKHGVTIDEIPDDEVSIKKDLKEAIFKDPTNSYLRTLFLQIVWSVTGRHVSVFKAPVGRGKLLLRLTEDEENEVRFLWDLYSTPLEDALRTTLKAFIHVQGIFPANAPEGKSATREELNKLRKAASAIDSIAKLKLVGNSNGGVR